MVLGKRIPALGLVILLVSLFSTFLLYRRGVKRKITPIETGHRETPLRQDYY